MFSTSLLALLATFSLKICYVQSHLPAMPHLVLIVTLGAIIIHPHFIDGKIMFQKVKEFAQAQKLLSGRDLSSKVYTRSSYP